MGTLSYAWREGDAEHDMLLVHVPGTAGKPYLFGREPHQRPIEIRDFHMLTTPITRALWARVMGPTPGAHLHPRLPMDDISWNDITRQGGFLERINSGEILSAVAGSGSSLRFRLPSETEWEYAARGGPHWTDGFRFSGSNDVDAVAWYGAKWSGGRVKWEILKRLKGWRLFDPQRGPDRASTRTHDVAMKAPNQLGLNDMSGNVWEWCEDTCVDDISVVPSDGSPWLGPGGERRLRGGCHHNWDIHCTVWWRYGITPDARDGCIGCRLVLAPI